MKLVVLASRNKDKEREIRELFSDSAIEIRSLIAYPEVPEIEETGTTLEENALIKARKVFEILHLPAIADDSGLEVYALNMRPGVFSARYAGENVTYADNNRKLLEELNGVQSENRGAQFRCVAAFVAPGIEHTEEGICRGSIIESPRGRQGFGYDPLFVPEGYNQTFAELGTEIKNKFSHRSRAFMALRKFLENYDF